jgi:hypothetical protein
MAATTTIAHTLVSSLTLTHPTNLQRESPSRIIARHEIVNREGDEGQDMGSESPPWLLQGRCTDAQKDTLRSFFDQVQIDTSNNGYVTLTQTDDNDATITSVDKLAIESMTFDYVGGLPHVWSFSIELRRYVAA